MKHPKSYDSTPEIRKRMSKVRLKNGKPKLSLQRGYGMKDTDIEETIKSSPVLPILLFFVFVLQSLLMESFGMAKIGKNEKSS